MLKVGFYVNDSKPFAVVSAGDLRRFARAHGLSVVDISKADVVIALGGDGTILRAVHECPKKPILGFNFGGLGYLAGVSKDDFESSLDILASGGYRVSERSMLGVCKENGERKSRVALNDIVITREMSGRAACIYLQVDNEFTTGFLADGLIFSTPTGSTAYSLAAGGPVLMPDTNCVVVTPINPHALGVRPMVVNDTSRFSIALGARSEMSVDKAGVYADGESAFSIKPGEVLKIGRAEHGALLVELNGYDPYEVLSRKFGRPVPNLTQERKEGR